MVDIRAKTKPTHKSKGARHMTVDTGWMDYSLEDLGLEEIISTGEPSNRLVASETTPLTKITLRRVDRIASEIEGVQVHEEKELALAEAPDDIVLWVECFYPGWSIVESCSIPEGDEF
jgi:hypothetical protein